MAKSKVRPTMGTPIASGMSRRDQAAALGLSLGELSRWVALADVPADEFERRLRAQVASGRRPTAETLIRGARVPIPGRVARAATIAKGMTPDERRALRGCLDALDFEGDKG